MSQREPPPRSGSDVHEGWDRLLTAYHEAGHVVMAWLTQGCSVVGAEIRARDSGLGEARLHGTLTPWIYLAGYALDCEAFQRFAPDEVRRRAAPTDMILLGTKDFRAATASLFPSLADSPTTVLVMFPLVKHAMNFVGDALRTPIIRERIETLARRLERDGTIDTEWIFLLLQPTLEREEPPALATIRAVFDAAKSMNVLGQAWDAVVACASEKVAAADAAADGRRALEAIAGLPSAEGRMRQLVEAVGKEPRLPDIAALAFQGG